MSRNARQVNGSKASVRRGMLLAGSKASAGTPVGAIPYQCRVSAACLVCGIITNTNSTGQPRNAHLFITVPRVGSESVPAGRVKARDKNQPSTKIYGKQIQGM